MSEQCTTNIGGTVYDFREVEASELWAKQLYATVQEGDRLLYKDAEFLVVKAPVKQDTHSSAYESCENCSLHPKNLMKYLPKVGSQSYCEHLTKLKEWELVQSSGVYDFDGPCIHLPYCASQNGDKFNFICTKSNVPWFVPSVETQNNISQESEQSS